MKFKLYLNLLLITGVLLSFCNPLYAQDVSLWKDASVSEFSEECYMKSMPRNYRLLELDLNKMKSELNTALYDSDPNAFLNAPIISLPLPEGGFGRFKVVRSEVLPDDTKPSYSNIIRTFSAVGIDDKYATAKLDYTIFGFHAMVMTPTGWFMIDPYSLTNSSHYISFYRRDKTGMSDFNCETENGDIRRLNPIEHTAPSVNRTSGANLKTYRLALSCTGEYAAFYGGTQAGALSGMVTSVNRVTGVYELELSVRLVLIANTTKLIFLNSATDPFTNNSGSTMLGQNQTVTTDSIGSANYDIGHVFSTGGGGVAGLGVVCNTSNKARGVTGSGSPVGDGFDIDYVAHEMGHQFAGNHTFNGALGSCSGGNRNASTAYEPGSGTTIMAYAGICSTDNTQSNSDPIFHVKSLDEMLTFVTTGSGSGCPTSTATGNAAPVITIPGNFTIPYLTPFTLTGSATDVNGNSLTYLWEEYDLGAQAQVNATQIAGSTFPLFRVFTPQTNGSRTFPKISDIVNNTSTIGERLPSVARNLNFRMTVRDNRLNGGAISNNDTPVQLTVVVTPDTFLVKQPNTALTWNAGSTQTVLWDVSGTDVAPINCANVNIYLSTDGGFTYPTTLASNVPNNGSASITVPGTLTTTARVKVEGAGNIFFDISNVNFTIAAGSAVLTSITTQPLASSILCAGSAISVSFSGDGPANAGNVYTAQLSTVGGAFPGTNIGTLSSTASSGTISCNILGGTTAGSLYRIRVVASNPAVTGSNNGSNLTVQQTVGAAGAITGTSTVCAGQNSVAYSVAAISNATTYNWTLPSGATIATGTGTNSITVNFSSVAVSGAVTVAGANTCFTGTTSTAFNVTVNPLPTALSAISGNAACAGQTATFSVSTNPTAVTYNWTLTGGGTIVSGNGTNTITANFPSATTGTLSVSGVNTCGSGAASTLAINVVAQPASPTISADGPTAICAGGNVSLSFTPDPANIYQWRKDGTLIGATTTSPLVATTAGTYDLASWTPQTYSTTTPVTIPDNLCAGGVASPISISGYTGTVTSAGISIMINITHTYVGDLILSLQTPTGQMMALTRSTGGSGDNFTNTIFTDAASTLITAGTAPFTGSFKPIATTSTTCTTTTITTFTAIGGGAINPNGTWNLIAIDNANLDLGTINNWSITIPTSTNAPCYGTGNSIAVTVTPVPAIVSFSPSTGSAGQTVTINGSGFTGATAVRFNGINATSFSVVNSSQITAVVPAGSTTGLVSVVTPCGTANSATNFTSEITLNLRLFIEGFYSAASTMRSPLGTSNSDSIDIRLASSVSPYATLFTSRNAFNTSGNGVFTFPGTAIGSSYYIVLKHRNSLETWSASPVSFATSSVTYDFTNAANKAFGSNQIQMSPGVWAIRSGDVNQDGFINHTDFTVLQATLPIFFMGYQIRDLTGDNCNESADYSLMENNSKLNLGILKP
jgi:subtilisin-like proprotein convertase family protein